MKAIKSLLAVSVLATAGAANAATVATWSSLTLTPTIILPSSYGPLSLVTSYSGSGSAVLDDSGTFTVTAHAHVETNVGTNNELDVRDIFTGTWDGTTFTATSATHEYTGCVDNPPVSVPGCSSLAGGGLTTAIAFSGSITLAGGSAQATSEDANSHASTTFKYDFGAGTPVTTPEVPVPAAAWLFGSGLLGLAGTARRRRTA